MNLEAWKILTEETTPDGTGATTVSIPHGNGNAIELETALLIYGLIRREQPIFAIETGTHWGFSAAVIGLALKDGTLLYPGKKPGVLYTVDSTVYDGKPEALWKRCGLDNIVRKIADSESAESYIGLPKDAAGFCWYDADHDGLAIFREYNATFPYLNKRRCVLGYHDVTLDKRMPGGILLILEDLKRRQRDGSGWKKVAHWPMRNMRGADFILLSNEDY